SIAALEPCCSWGISTNVERTLTAIAFSRSILPALTPESQIVQSSTAGGWAALGLTPGLTGTVLKRPTLKEIRKPGTLSPPPIEGRRQPEGYGFEFYLGSQTIP